MKKVLTIAGSDSCGGAGIQADLKTMDALGVYGMSVITAVTAQNSCGVFAVQEIDTKIIEQQIDAIFSDIDVDAIKIGMLSSSEIIKTVKKSLQQHNFKNLVIDPVMISKSGYPLLKDEAINELKNLIPLSILITPNIPEAEVLTGKKIKTIEDMIIAGKEIQKYGVPNVLIKGGHHIENAIDILITKDGEIIQLFEKKIESKNTHGTGCTLSSSIASHLAKGYNIKESVQLSKKYITTAIQNSFSIGEGVGPVGHLIELYKKCNIKF